MAVQKAYARIEGLKDLVQILYFRDFEFNYSEIFNEIQLKGNLIFYNGNEITFNQNERYILIQKFSNSYRLLIDYGGNLEIELYLGPEYKISYYYPYLEIKKR